MRKPRIELTPEMEKRLMAMRAQGFTAKQVAKELGISDRTAQKRMARFPRVPAEHQNLKIKPNRGGVSLSAEAEVIMPKHIKIQRCISVLSDKAPICNATVFGEYKGTELAYRR